jgi:toxin ParE1/3/4
MADLIAIRDYIELDNRVAAQQAVIAILRSLEQLSVFPRIGRKGRAKGTLELVVRKPPYIVVYRVNVDCIEIVAIVHLARQRPFRTVE